MLTKRSWAVQFDEPDLEDALHWRGQGSTFVQLTDEQYRKIGALTGAVSLRD